MVDTVNARCKDLGKQYYLQINLYKFPGDLDYDQDSKDVPAVNW